MSSARWLAIYPGISRTRAGMHQLRTKGTTSGSNERDRIHAFAICSACTRRKYLECFMSSLITKRRRHRKHPEAGRRPCALLPATFPSLLHYEMKQTALVTLVTTTTVTVVASSRSCSETGNTDSPASASNQNFRRGNTRRFLLREGVIHEFITHKEHVS